MTVMKYPMWREGPNDQGEERNNKVTTRFVHWKEVELGRKRSERGMKAQKALKVRCIAESNPFAVGYHEMMCVYK